LCRLCLDGADRVRQHHDFSRQGSGAAKPASLIYTAGVGYNVNGTAAQPLSGFTQYQGQLALAGVPIGTTNLGKAFLNYINYEPPSTYLTHGGDLTLSVGRNIVGAMTTAGPLGHDESDLPYDMTALGSQL